MTVDIRPFPRLGWDPLPGEGAVGVVGRVVVREEDFFVAQLRFSAHATVHEHPGERETIVVCLDGEGFTSVAGETVPLREGQQARWPRGIPHRLWTENSTMTTLMVERLAVEPASDRVGHCRYVSARSAPPESPAPQPPRGTTA